MQWPVPERVSLEARILEAVGDRSEARALRWRCFEARLSADILRDYLKPPLGFEDIEAEERAHALALSHANPYVDLQRLLEWPRHELATKVIETHRNIWNGRDWHILPKIAGTLEHQHRVAATILYRVILNDILARTRSKAYAHGAKYLAKLDMMAGDADVRRPDGIADHATYPTRLKQAHACKTAFWTLVEGNAEQALASFRARRPRVRTY